MSRKMQKNNMKPILLMSIVIGALFVLPLIQATTTLVAPASGNNESSTMAVNVTTDATDCAGCLNATLYYNASGGPVDTSNSLTTITNDTADDTVFYSSSVDISGLADGTYNFSAQVDNGSAQTWTGGNLVTIDNTNPTGTLTISKASISTNRNIEVTWTSSDATSTVETVSLTVTSPDTDRCATQTSSAASGTLEIGGSSETGCTGTYTVSLTITDYAGNSYTTSDTFKVTESGTTRDGSNTLGGSSDDTDSNKKVWLVLAIAFIIIFAVSRKK